LHSLANASRIEEISSTPEKQNPAEAGGVRLQAKLGSGAAETRAK